MENKVTCALALKGNQGRLRDDVRLFRDDPSTPLA